MNFNALNGQEVKEFVLRRVGEVLEESGEFPTALTFPWFKFDFTLKVIKLSGTEENPGADGELKVSGAGEVPQENSSIPDRSCTGPTESVELSGEGTVSVPDEARIQSGQPIHVEEVTDAGVKVDKPRKVARPAPWLQGGKV